MIAQIESLMSAFGGAGMENKVSEAQQKEIDNFNKCVLDLALKLDNSIGLKSGKATLTTIVQFTKRSMPTMVDGFLKVTCRNENLLKKKDPSFWEFFPLKTTVEFKDLGPDAQKNLWAYANKLQRIAMRYKTACETNPLASLTGMNLDGIAGGALGDFKGVLKKYGITKEKFIAFATDTAAVIPVESILEAIPAGIIPGLDPSSVDSKSVIEITISTAADVLFSESLAESVVSSS